MGRKATYRKEFHDSWAWSLAIRGCTDAEIAEAMGVSRKTICEWKYNIVDGVKVLSSFGEALLNGKESIDSQIEQALFKRATGYTITEREQYTEEGKRKVKLKDRHIPPDVRAMEIWLYNRQREYWRSPNSPNLNIITGSITEESEMRIVNIFKQVFDESNQIEPPISEAQIEYVETDDE